MTILQAMADSSLFGRVLKRSLWHGDTWRSWRCFLSALFGLGLIENEDMALYQKHTGRTDIQESPYREAYVISGRRSGKSFVAALIAAFLAAFQDFSKVLSAGEVGVVMILAADKRQARVCLGYVQAFFEIPLLSRMVVSRLKESITLRNNVRIEVHASDYRSVRGFTIVAAILDEAAFWPTDDSASPDTEVLNALRPGMSTVRNGLLLAVSSPYARRGILWQAFRENFGKAGAPVLVWQSDTRSMNPTVSKGTIDAAYLTDAVSAAAEYGGEFRNDIQGFLPLQVVETCIVANRFELPPVPGVSYSAFADPSGGESDSFTLAIAHEEGQRAVLDVLRERLAPFSPESVVMEFSAVLRKYGLSAVTGDKYAGQWPSEQFGKRGIEYRPSERNRSELYLELLPLLTSGRAELLDNGRLKSQLCALERRTARAGRDSIDHAPGGHDDCSNAAAGALVLVAGEGGVLGLVQYLQRVEQGIYNPEEKKVFPTITTKRPEPPREEPGRCPNCGTACVIVIAGQGRHCNCCGEQWYPKGKPLVLVAGFEHGRPTVIEKRGT